MLYPFGRISWKLRKLMSALKMISGLCTVSIEASGIKSGMLPIEILGNEKPTLAR